MYKNKNILFILCLITLLCLVGCSNSPTTNIVDEPNSNLEQNNNLDKVVFEAQVLEVYEKSIMVKPAEGSAESKSSDKITLGISDINVDFDISVGQTVKITYDGIILESYPAQIHSVYSIEKVETQNSISNGIADLDNRQEEWGVILSTKDVTSSGLTIVCEQTGGVNVSELNTGSYYTIQKLTNTGFVDVEYLSQEYDVAWDAMAYIIGKESITTWEIDWEWLYGNLPVGEYRIGKEIMNFRGAGDFDKEMIYAHFEIK